MNGDMLDAGSPMSYQAAKDTLGFIPMTKAGSMVQVRIEGLAEADFSALLRLASGHEELGHNLILAEVDGEVRLYWHNDVGDSACWRFPEKKREAVKTAVLSDIQSYEKATKRGLF